MNKNEFSRFMAVWTFGLAVFFGVPVGLIAGAWEPFLGSVICGIIFVPFIRWIESWI